MRKIGLFFGSFNPIHIGHLILSNYILEYGNIDEIWFVVSPQNPLKNKKALLHDIDRLDMVEMAIKNYPKMRANNIEFSMSKPSYTIDTLAYLKEKFPKHKFFLILGEDNLQGLPKWKNSEYIIKHYDILVYPRSIKGGIFDWKAYPNIIRINAPKIEISSTLIRNMIKEDKNIRPMLPPEIYEYIDRKGFYK